MSEIHLTDTVLARIVKSVAAAARQNPAASQSALLNIATAEVVGPGRDWGLIRNAPAPVRSRDLVSDAGGVIGQPKGAARASVDAVTEPAGYLYEAKVRFVSTDPKMADLDLGDIAYEVAEGDAVGGPLMIERTALDRRSRDALAREFGSDPSFFGDAEDTLFQVIVEVSCLVGFDELDEEDRDEFGNCSVDGSYAITVEAPEDTSFDHVIEVAKDLFHDSIAISCLDDFDIVVRRRTSADMDGSLSDLGTITATEERLEELAAEDSGMEP